MAPVLVFLVVAALVGCLIRAVVGLRLRAAARQPDVLDEEICQLQQASRISSTAVVVTLVGLAVLGLAALLL